MGSPAAPFSVTGNAFPDNPYVYTRPSSGSTDHVQAMAGLLAKCGRRVEDTALNFWTHVRTGPNIIDTAWGRLNLGAKVLTHGGFEQIFLHKFDSLPDEKLIDSFACYLSTSSGPIAGTLYASTRRIAFASDRMVSYQISPGVDVSGYYTVVIPVEKMRMVKAAKNPKSHHEKYIQLITTDEYEFWFMGFLNHVKGLKVLEDLARQYWP